MEEKTALASAKDLLEYAIKGALSSAPMVYSAAFEAIRDLSVAVDANDYLPVLKYLLDKHELPRLAANGQQGSFALELSPLSAFVGANIPLSEFRENNWLSKGTPYVLASMLSIKGRVGADMDKYLCEAIGEAAKDGDRIDKCYKNTWGEVQYFAHPLNDMVWRICAGRHMQRFYMQKLYDEAYQTGNGIYTRFTAALASCIAASKLDDKSDQWLVDRILSAAFDSTAQMYPKRNDFIAAFELALRKSTVNIQTIRRWMDEMGSCEDKNSPKALGMARYIGIAMENQDVPAQMVEDFLNMLGIVQGEDWVFGEQPLFLIGKELPFEYIQEMLDAQASGVNVFTLAFAVSYACAGRDVPEHLTRQMMRHTKFPIYVLETMLAAHNKNSFVPLPRFDTAVLKEIIGGDVSDPKYPDSVRSVVSQYAECTISYDVIDEWIDSDKRTIRKVAVNAWYRKMKGIDTNHCELPPMDLIQKGLHAKYKSVRDVADECWDYDKSMILMLKTARANRNEHIPFSVIEAGLSSEDPIVQGMALSACKKYHIPSKIILDFLHDTNFSSPTSAELIIQKAAMVAFQGWASKVVP